MSRSASEQLALTPGSSRVTCVWMSPAAPHDDADDAVPASAGQWVERQPGTFARHTVAVPVTVGSDLRV